jgi:hypothetical protein
VHALKALHVLEVKAEVGVSTEAEDVRLIRQQSSFRIDLTTGSERTHTSHSFRERRYHSVSEPAMIQFEGSAPERHATENILPDTTADLWWKAQQGCILVIIDTAWHCQSLNCQSCVILTAPFRRPWA